MSKTMQRTCRRRIAHLHQERKLRDFLEGGGMLAAHGGSRFGAQLDRQAMFSFGVKPCPECRTRKVERAVGRRFPGTPARQKQALDFYLAHPDIELDWNDPDEHCRRCDGSGIVVLQSLHHAEEELTAQPTGCQPRNEGHCLDDAAVEFCGRVASWLAQVGRKSSVAPEVLCAVYGPGGGNYRSIWHMTEGGRSLAERRKRQDRTSLAVWYHEQAELQTLHPEYHRGRAIERADQEAEKLPPGCGAPVEPHGAIGAASAD